MSVREHKEWWPSGQLKKHCFYNKIHLYTDGYRKLYHYWWIDGQVKKDCYHNNNKDRELHGEYKLWITGELDMHQYDIKIWDIEQAIGYCFHLDPDGLFHRENWCKNDTLEVHCFYRNDALHGECIWCDDGGVRKHELYEHDSIICKF